jgi:hypothetical protein
VLPPTEDSKIPRPPENCIEIGALLPGTGPYSIGIIALNALKCCSDMALISRTETPSAPPHMVASITLFNACRVRIWTKGSLTIIQTVRKVFCHHFNR